MQLLYLELKLTFTFWGEKSVGLLLETIQVDISWTVHSVTEALWKFALT